MAMAKTHPSFANLMQLFLLNNKVYLILYSLALILDNRSIKIAKFF